MGVSKLTFKTLLDFFLMVGIGGGKGKLISTIVIVWSLLVVMGVDLSCLAVFQ